MTVIAIGAIILSVIHASKAVAPGYICDQTSRTCTRVTAYTSLAGCQNACASPSPKPSWNDLITMVWSGGDPLTTGLTPYQTSTADLVALASALPGSSSGFFTNVWNYITGTPPTISDPNKYLISIGGSSASPEMWINMMNSDITTIINGFTALYASHNINGIDWDLEGLPADPTAVVSFCGNVSRILKSTYKDYRITFTIMASYVSPLSANYIIASQINQFPSGTLDYVVLMLYGNTMYTAGSDSASGGVAWSSYMLYGNTKLKCLYQQNPALFPTASGAVTVVDMFKSSGAKLIIGVILSGTYPCGNACLQSVYNLCGSSGLNISGIAIWCYGAYAAECQCTTSAPQHCAKMKIIDQIVSAFKNKNVSALPSDADIQATLDTAGVLPWKAYDGYGCAL